MTSYQALYSDIIDTVSGGIKGAKTASEDAIFVSSKQLRFPKVVGIENVLLLVEESSRDRVWIWLTLLSKLVETPPVRSSIPSPSSPPSMAP